VAGVATTQACAILLHAQACVMSEGTCLQNTVAALQWTQSDLTAVRALVAHQGGSMELQVSPTRAILALPLFASTHAAQKSCQLTVLARQSFVGSSTDLGGEGLATGTSLRCPSESDYMASHNYTYPCTSDDHVTSLSLSESPGPLCGPTNSSGARMPSCASSIAAFWANCNQDFAWHNAQ
jgi:hypothetical protein